MYLCGKVEKAEQMYASKEKRDAFLSNLNDRRHGTSAGYYLAYCQCDKCAEFRAEHNRQRRKAAIAKKNRMKTNKKTVCDCATRKKPNDCCTIDEVFLPMMGKPSITAPYCVVCGASNVRLDQHHPVKRSAGKLVIDGREIKKPTLTLCRKCHDLLHAQGLLYFKWVDAGSMTDLAHAHMRFDHGGHYEFLLLTEEERRKWIESHPLPNGELPSRVGYMNALEIPHWERTKQCMT